jgi:hypothetical protein
MLAALNTATSLLCPPAGSANAGLAQQTTPLKITSITPIATAYR